MQSGVRLKSSIAMSPRPDPAVASNVTRKSPGSENRSSTRFHWLDSGRVQKHR